MTLDKQISLSEYSRLPRSPLDIEYYKRHLEAICNNSTLALFIMDERQYCIYMNPAAEELTGYSLAEVEGRALHDVIHHTRPDGRPYPLCECPIDQAFPQNNQEQGEEVFVHRDGHFYPVAYTASPIREPKGIVGTIIEVRDITQEKLEEQARQAAIERERILRQEAEAAKAQTEQILQSITDVFCVYDRGWRFTYVNAAAIALIGLPKDEILGRSLWEMYPDLVGTDHYNQYHRALREQTNLEFEFYYAAWDRWLRHRVYASNTGVSAFTTDITEEKRTEQALQKSEARFRSLFDCNIIPLGIWTKAGSVVEANDALLNLIGYPREALHVKQINWRSLTPTEYLERDEQAIAETIRQGYCVPYEKEYIHQDGHRVPILIGGGTFPGDEDSGFFFAFDLSDRYAAEAELREAHIQLKAALSAGAISTWRWNVAENRVFTDASFARLFNVDPDEAAKGLPIEDFVNGIAEQDRDRVVAAIQKAIGTGEEYVSEYRLCTADGEVRWVAARGHVEYDSQGNPVSFPGAIADITEHKQITAALSETEEQLRLALESAQLGAWDYNPITGDLMWDNSCKTMIGVPIDAEVNYDVFLAKVHPDDRDQANQAIERVLDPAIGGTLEIEFRVLHAEGDRWIASRGKAFFDESGKATRLVGTVRDVTEAKRYETEREQLLERERAARSQAEKANQMKDEFLAVLSHELRTPLNPILGWIKLLKLGRCDAARTEQALETIDRNAQLQARLIEDLLDVSRILQGKLTFSPEPIDLTAAIHAALETTRLAAEAKSLHIELNLESNVGFVKADPNRLQQVIWNLLSNSVKFTPSNGRIEIHLTQRQNDACLIVKDNGKGIRSDILPFIFDRFRQADSSTTRQFGGLGLGLAIVRHLVELHGGTITAESPGEGQGATFTVRLPITMAHPSSSQTFATPEADRDLEGMKILAVDDEPDNLDFLVFLLEESGAMVLGVQSASEAIAALPQFLPSLLISDIGMPEMDGYELIQQIRQLPPEAGGKIPAIALTAYAGEVNQQQAIAAGYQLHLAKPLQADDLIEAIRNLC